MKDSWAHQNFKWPMKIVKFVTYTCTFIGLIAIPVRVLNGLDLGPICLQNFNISGCRLVDRKSSAKMYIKFDKWI